MSDTSIETHTQTQIDHDGDSMPCVRIFGLSPDRAALQIRSYGALTGGRGGKDRPAYSTAHLTAAQIVEIRALLLIELERLKKYA